MVRLRAELGSLRFSRLEQKRLLLALLFSLFCRQALPAQITEAEVDQVANAAMKAFDVPALPSPLLKTGKPCLQKVMA